MESRYDLEARKSKKTWISSNLGEIWEPEIENRVHKKSRDLGEIRKREPSTEKCTRIGEDCNHTKWMFDDQSRLTVY
jgi:hypothetical protein